MASAKDSNKATQKELDNFETNYAARPIVADRFMKEYLDLAQTVRNDRLTMEEKWLDDYRQWSCVMDNDGYTGRANIFVPELNNQIESSVEKNLGQMFPGPDFIHAVPLKGTKEEEADFIKEAVLYELEQRNKLFLLQDEHQRQKVLLGTSPLKGGYKKEMIDIFTRDRKGNPIKSQVPKHHGTKWDVVDLFRWYIYPETSTIENAHMVMEDQFMSMREIKKAGIYTNLENIMPVDQDTRHQWADVERLDLVSLSTACRARPGSVVLTEIWTEFELRQGLIVPVLGVIANYRTLIRLVRNPFWFQHAPYCASRYLARPGKVFYGLSLPDKIRSQGKSMNDLMNQTMDSITYALNPIAIIDPALAGDVNSMKFMPGARWLGSPEGIRFEQMVDVSPTGLRAMQEVRGQIAQFSDNSPGIAPQLQGKVRSATQAGIVQQGVSQKQKVQTKNEELNVSVPMCKMTHMLLLQYQEEEYQIMIQGPEAGEWITKSIDPAKLVGDVEWIWKGAEQDERNAVKSQQLIAFYQAALQTAAILPPGELDIGGLFRRIAKEAFNIERLDEIFKSLRDQKTVDAKLENIILKDGTDLPINAGDNDDEHITDHNVIMDDPKVTDEVKLVTLRHIEKHEVQKKGKAALTQMKARLDALKMVQDQGGGNGGGVDGRQLPQPPGIGEGNQNQVSTSPASVMKGVAGARNV